MREYSLGIPTNAWNAIRYVLITLALVPLAENLWSRMHSKLTGARLMRGRAARLRQSKLAHWGLHQEVDEKSRLSVVSAIVVCVLHITSMLLLEYGSGSEERYMMQNAVLSRTVRDDGGLRKDRIYFFDAGYVLGIPHGLPKCIDGRPRTLKDFGLTLRKNDNEKILSHILFPKPKGNFFQLVHYFVKNSGNKMRVVDNGTARWYFGSTGREYYPAPRSLLGFVNKAIACRIAPEQIFFCTSNKGKVEQAAFLSHVLAWSIVPGASDVHWPLFKQNETIGAILDRISVQGNENPLLNAEAEQQTAWIRKGMNRIEFPQTRKEMSLNLKIAQLQEGCDHKYGIPVSNLDPFKDLKVSEPNFPGTLHKFIPDSKMVIWIDGNSIQIGFLFQQGNEFCSDAPHVRVCVKKVESGKHEMAFFQFEKWEDRLRVWHKTFNFSVEGSLPQHSELDLAIQASVEVTRRNSFTWSLSSIGDIRIRVTRLIESGKLLSGLLRVADKQVHGKSVLHSSDIATINILGIVGAVILVFLVVLPIPFLFVHRKSTKVDIESLYRSTVMQTHGPQSCVKEICGEVPPSKPPSNIATGVSEGKIEKFQGTYKSGTHGKKCPEALPAQ